MTIQIGQYFKAAGAQQLWMVPGGRGPSEGSMKETGEEEKEEEEEAIESVESDTACSLWEQKTKKRLERCDIDQNKQQNVKRYIRISRWQQCWHINNGSLHISSIETMLTNSPAVNNDEISFKRMRFKMWSQTKILMGCCSNISVGTKILALRICQMDKGRI